MYFVYTIKYKVITCIVIRGAATQDVHIFENNFVSDALWRLMVLASVD